MPDSIPAKPCALCGVTPITVREERWKDYLCFDCLFPWNTSPECINLLALPGRTPEVRLTAIQAFVRRVRRERCKTPNCGVVQADHSVIPFDCYGCAAYAAREVAQKTRCIHEMPNEDDCELDKANHECNGHEHCAHQYVPRACGNCGVLTGCPRIERGKTVCEHWQPRPADPPKVESTQTCGACGKYNLEEKYGYEGYCGTGARHNRADIACTSFVEKSCSLCGHFHPEPLKDSMVIGYCAKLSEIAPPDVLYKGHYTMSQVTYSPCKTWYSVDYFTPRAARGHKCNDVCHCSSCKYKDSQYTKTVCSTPCIHYTYDKKDACLWEPRAAPVMNKCQICGKETQLSGGYCNQHQEEFDIFHPIKTESSPACARCSRCGYEKPKYKEINIDSKSAFGRLVPWCSDCENEMTKQKEIMYSSFYDKETAAGRPWAVDKIIIKMMADKTLEDRVVPAAAPVTHKLAEYECQGWVLHTKNCGDVPCRISYPLHGGKMDTSTGLLNAPCHYGYGQQKFKYLNQKESDAKMAFKCAQCGYEDETRKKVVYCPRCGAEVAKKDPVKKTCKTCHYNWDAKGNFQECRPIIGLCDNHSKWAPMDAAAESKCERISATMPYVQYAEIYQELDSLKREKGDLARQVSEADTTISRQLVAIDKLNLEIGIEKMNYNEVATQLNAANETIASLRRRGVPWNVRRAMKQGYAHCNVGEGLCCGIFDKAGEKGQVKCNECGAEFTPKELKRLSTPAKPAALWRLRLQRNWLRAKKTRRDTKHEKAHLKDMAYLSMVDQIKEFKKQLEGAA